MPAFTATLRKLLGSAKPIHTPLPPSSSFENVFQQWSLVDVPDNVKVTHINWPADKGLAFPAVQTFDLEAHAIIEDELTAFTNAFGTRAAVDIPAICVTEPEDDAELCALVNETPLQFTHMLALPVDEDEEVEVDPTPAPRSAIRHKPGMI